MEEKKRDAIDISSPEAQAAQLEVLKEKVMRQILTKEARERMANVRIANPILALQVELYLMQLYQAGQIKSLITGEQLKQILMALTKKKKTSIVRK